MVEPATKGKVSLRDLKNCKLTHIFFDTFFNLDKYLEHEQRDPFASLRVSLSFCLFYFSCCSTNFILSISRVVDKAKKEGLIVKV